MKCCSRLAIATATIFAAAPALVSAAEIPAPFIYETPQEFFGVGDFDGDGQPDLVVVDKESGKYRLGYRQASGVISWVDNRPSGLKNVSGFSIGKLLATNRDALVLTAPVVNQVAILDASSPAAPTKPIPVSFSALGPNTIVALKTAGAGSAKLADLYISSIYNSPDQYQANLLLNDGAQFPSTAEEPLPGPASKGNRLALKMGQPEVICLLVTSDKGDALRIEDVSSGKPVLIGSLSELPAGSDYVVGNFRGSPFVDFVFYKPGEKSMTIYSLEGSTPGKVEFGKGSSFDLGQPVRRIVVLNGTVPKLFIIFGEGEQGGVFSFDGKKAPALSQTIIATNDLLTCAVSVPGGLIAFSESSGGKFSNRYYAHSASGSTYTFSVFGSLPSLADNDNITIPEIHERIAANVKIKAESEMKIYTNQIPGTPVSYVMVPIRGGELLMGSADREKGRKPDEGPQHKVKISPFWMGQCEITWNEYELFMFPDEEKRIRASSASDSPGDSLADAITHPSKPYVEMSFGMGKDGFPAIAMTHHAANKYCQWLSAKTGEFYRLPTEAEWEYACRAGTTTPYFFGKDAKQLGDYAWYEQNSDFKYQKVGKKKPNPWGLYDIYGNVTEWVLDQYDPDFYKQCAGRGMVTDPWNRATEPYPLAVRGGSWDDEANLCRSAARRGSDRAWKMTDPQLPKSIWYFTDAQFVGFRLVRPLQVPGPGEMQKCWTSGVERD